MNLPQEWMPCLELAGLLAMEVVLVVGAAAALERCTRSPLWHRAFWQGATLGLGLLLLLEVSGLSRDAIGWAWTLIPARRADLAFKRASTTPHAAVLSAGAGQLNSGFRGRVAGQLAFNRRTGTTGPEKPEPAFAAPAGGSVMVAQPTGEPTSAEPFLQNSAMPWPELIWVIGIAAALGPVLLARLFLFIFHQRRERVREATLSRRVTDLSGRLGIRRRVEVFQSANLAGPVAFGILRPRVGIPEHFTRDFSSAQQEVMLAHELAHLAARDPAWQALADVVASLLWWHPLVWWARHRLRVSAETAADEASLLIADGPGLLAECLLQLASRAVTRQPLGWLSATGPGFRSGLGRRIERLINLGDSTWSPLNRLHSRSVKLAVPLVLVAVAIACTAWAGPQTHGEAMKTIKETWRRSVATVALLTAFGAEPSAAHAAAPPRAPAAPPATAVKLPATPATPDGAVLQAKATSDAEPAGSEPQPVVEPAPAEQPTPDSTNYRMDPRLLQRYGLSPRQIAAYTNASPARPNRGRQQIEAKLNQITLNDIQYDGLPLKEVVQDLNEQARKRDPAKQGINFLISNVPENPVPVTGGIDPTTGVPIPTTAPVVDLGATIVQLHLRDVRLKDVLDAMTRVSEQPIRYSVEDYGVLFSPAGPMPAVTAAANHPPELPRLQVRTFKVETNTFLAGLESAFGVTVPRAEGQAASPGEKKAAIIAAKAQVDLKRAEELHAQKAISEDELRKAKYDLDMAQAELEEARAQKGSGQFASARDIQQGLRQLLLQLGINMDVPNKGVFYNELTGIVMVRATSDDLEVVQAAIETLGGHLLRLGVGEPALTRSVCVYGKVNKEGPIGLPTEAKVDILEGIARAGGFSPTANKNKIELNRNGTTTTYKFDDLKRAKDLDKKIWLEPGDVIYVHESFF